MPSKDHRYDLGKERDRKAICFGCASFSNHSVEKAKVRSTDKTKGAALPRGPAFDRPHSGYRLPWVGVDLTLRAAQSRVNGAKVSYQPRAHSLPHKPGS